MFLKLLNIPLHFLSTRLRLFCLPLIVIVLCYNYDFLYVIDEFDFSIIQMKVPYIFDSKTVEEINLRQKYNLNLIAIVHDGKATGNITPKTMLYSSDSMYICGTNKNITEFQDKLK